MGDKDELEPRKREVEEKAKIDKSPSEDFKEDNSKVDMPKGENSKVAELLEEGKIDEALEIAQEIVGKVFPKTDDRIVAGPPLEKPEQFAIGWYEFRARDHEFLRRKR